MIALELILILTFGFLIRFIFLLTPTGVASDKLNVFYQLKRQQGSKWINYNTENSLNEGSLANSQFLFFLISKLQQNKWMKVSSYLNFLFDLAVAFGVFFIVKYFLELPTEEFSILSPASWAALIYLTTPVLMPINGRIMGGPKARSFGGMLAFLYFLTLYATIHIDPFYIILASLLIYITILSSVFATQAIIIFTICLALFYTSLILLIPMIFLILLYFVPSFRVTNIVNYKIAHFRYFYNNIDAMAVSDRNSLKYYKELFSFKKNINFGLLYYDKIAPFILVHSFPVFFIFIVYVVSFENINPFVTYSYFIVLASLITFILTSIKPFVMIGQAERYFEFSAAFATIFLIYFCKNEQILFILFVIQLCFVLINYLYINRNPIKKELQFPHPKELKDVADFLMGLNQDINGLGIPLKITRSLGFLTYGCKNIRFYQRGVEKDLLFYDTIDKNDNFPDDLNLYIKNYGINTLIIAKSARSEEYDYSSYKLIYENQTFKIYEVIE